MGVKKIGILFFNSINDGGVFQYTESLLDLLGQTKSDNYEFVIFCFDKTKINFNSTFEVRQVHKKSSSFIIKSIRLFFLLLNIRSKIFFTESELNNFSDIDLLYSPVSAIYPHFYLNKPFIYTFHDLQDKYYPKYFTKKELFLRHITNKFLTKYSEYIICESEYVRKDIIKYYKIDERKIFILQSPPTNNYLEFKFDDSKFKLIRYKYQLPEFYIYYPAQSWHHKNHIRLLLAFKEVLKKYTNLKLVLSGSKKNNHAIILSKIVELKLTESVIHIGYISSDDIPYIYYKSSALIMPSLFESISIPIYEAFALNVPVSCSNIYGIPEQVENGALLFDPFSINDMALKIIEILENTKLRILLTENGFKIIKSFNNTKFVNHFLSIIDNYFYNVND